jgi:hypothetical protein
MRYLLPLLLLSTAAFADDRTTCPDPTPCKVITLTAAEEKILLDERGILATASQARALDLAALVTYFQGKIARAPAGDKPPEKDQSKPPSAGSMSGDKSNDHNGISPKP